MGLFNFHSSTKNNTVQLPVIESAESKSDVVVNSPVNEAQEDKKPLTVSYATGRAIDVIYGYLNKNYEAKGFEDAMINGDIAFREMNMSLIKNKILMVFREVRLKYTTAAADLQTKIASCNAAGLITTVENLQIQQSMVESHLEELDSLEENFRNGTTEASIPLQSYSVGFLRGLSTLALGGTSTKGASVVGFSAPASTAKDSVVA